VNHFEGICFSWGLSGLSWPLQIAGGCFMRMCVAVDFTGSNGDPRDPSSLHYINPYRQPHQPGNEYEQAITNIGRIVSPYASVQSFPTFGFVRPPPCIASPWQLFLYLYLFFT
jgi:hypothetical protein